MDRKKIFISHCSDDTEIMKAVSRTIPEIFPEYDVFNTFEESIRVGKERAEQIRRNLLDSDFMIAFVTDAYMRSVICFSEISAFWLQDKPVFPIVYNGKSGQQFLEKLTGKDKICFDVQESRADDLPHELIGVLPDVKKPESSISWALAAPSDPDRPARGRAARPYIGSDAVYKAILQYCLQSGIVRMQDRPLSPETIRRHFVEDLPESIWLVGTTHLGFIRNYAETLAEVLARGTDVYCLIANKNSEFCRDVGAIEAFPGEFAGDKEKWLKEAEEEADRLSREFEGVRDQLRQISNTSSVMAGRLGTEKGHLYFGCTFTVMRQTIIMAVNETRNSLWAWMSVTIPPQKASDGTPGIEVHSTADDGNDKFRSLSETLYSHVKEIREMARFRGCLFDVQDGIPESFPVSEETQTETGLQSVRAQWETWYASAERRMARRRKHDSRIDLIEIAAQHPLKDGKTPDRAFEDRLLFAMDLYEKLKKEGRQAHLYVPGSVHIPDTVSLSAAGIRYLMESGRVDPQDILGEEINEEYKGDAGVYNSADECYVASEIYKEGSYCELHCVCSANQMLRKKLFYFRFGVIPQMWAIPDDSFHSDIGEVFESIPDVLLHDADWQKHTSRHFIRTRQERMPGWQDE